MSSSLSDEQSAAVRQWAEEGADLAAIQKRLDEEFEVRLTFMDTRFLIADLGIELAEEEEPEPEPEPEPAAVVGAGADAGGDPAGPGAEGMIEAEVIDGARDHSEPQAAESPVADDPQGQSDGEGDDESASATVTISEVQRPGVMISGTVTFDSGDKAEWYLDQMGQLGMNPEAPEFRPSPAQMRAFQMELQKAAQQKGF